MVGRIARGACVLVVATACPQSSPGDTESAPTTTTTSTATSGVPTSTGSGTTGTQSSGDAPTSTSFSSTTSTSSSSTASTTAPLTGTTDATSTSTGYDTTSTGSTTVAPEPEDCLDGADNDGDTLVDCADPDCDIGFECVDEAPPGWEGYFRVHRTAYPNLAPSPCPDASAPTSQFDTIVPAVCSACTCGAAVGGACDIPPLNCWGSSEACAGAPIDLPAAPVNGGCFVVPQPLTTGAGMRSCAISHAPQVINPGIAAAPGARAAAGKSPAARSSTPPLTPTTAPARASC